MMRAELAGAGDAEELAEFFIRHMPMDLRRRLMAERPLLYARVFPAVKPAILLARVAHGLAGVNESQAEAHAAHADQLLSRSATADRLASAWDARVADDEAGEAGEGCGS
jgi:hypothetical protein